MPRTVAIALLVLTAPAVAQEPHTGLKAALKKSGDNQSELVAAMQHAPADQKEAMEFLITHMPVSDLQSLSAEFLLENVRLAYEARAKTRWGRSIPKRVFFNNVLPYANVDEPRDKWRREFMDRFLPVVANCRTPSEAAQKLNQTVFSTLNVRYSTQRRRANQSPKECMETGLASCTGLSIVLTDACRAVGVPARLAGIASWANKRGNHTWVEIWDKQWHFTGAAEPNAKGLNHTWFQGDAALARADSRLHSIYAVSYEKTDTSFPMVWSPQTRWVNAVNVTTRYAPNSPSPSTKTRVMVRVWNTERTQRVAAKVALAVADSGDKAREGTSRDESFDTNDILTFNVPRDSKCSVRVSSGGAEITQAVFVGDRSQVTVDVVLPRISSRD